MSNGSSIEELNKIHKIIHEQISNRDNSSKYIDDSANDIIRTLLNKHIKNIPLLVDRVEYLLSMYNYNELLCIVTGLMICIKYNEKPDRLLVACFR